jgi:hypothetical protein
MVQIRFFVLFILAAAAAVVPVGALPGKKFKYSTDYARMPGMPPR